MQRFSQLLISKRIIAMVAGSACIFALLCVRLGYLQFVRGESLRQMALDQRLRPIPVLAPRGDILDRNREALAISVSAESAYAIPIEVTSPEGEARTLSRILDMPYDNLLERLKRRQAMSWLKLNLAPATTRALLQANLPGIGVVERPVRDYPQGSLAAQVLGFAGVDNQGLEGLEAYYDTYLRGTDGKVVRERDATGRAIPGGVEKRFAPVPGETIVLTIDAGIQRIVERELRRAVLETQSEYGMFVALDPKTGGVLAMATYPSFDPNAYGRSDPKSWRNRPVTDQYEPGSIFKIVTGSAALDAGVVGLNETFVDPVTIHRWGVRISCWKGGGHGTETFVQVTENSCNPIFAIIGADRLGGVKFRRYASAFGFGAPLGIDFPGEGTGRLAAADAPDYTWANIGFGQGLAVTPLQMAAAAATIANDGVLMRPHFLKEVLAPDGHVVKQVEPEVVAPVLKPSVAKEFAGVLRKVVINGSGKLANAPGYGVAGKTGTAQIAEGGHYLKGTNMASFVGFAPYDDPKLAGVIMLYKVGVQPTWGGLRAAPVFGRIIGPVLQILGVKPQTEGEDGAASEEADKPVAVPNVEGMSVGDAQDALHKAGLGWALDGAGGRVFEQVPAPGAELAAGGSVMLSLYDGPPGDLHQVTVPDVTGLSLEDAAYRLARVHLYIRIDGEGRAVAQDPPAGARLTEYQPVRVRFAQ